MDPQIIHKDRHILILDKPAGMPCTAVKEGEPNTLAKWIIQNFPKQRKLKSSPEEGGLVHRLDNDTSGIIVAVLTDKAYQRLREIWSSKEVTKEYRCLALGQTPPEGKISTLIAHHPQKAKKMMVVTDPEEGRKLKARYAETEYELLEGFLDYSYLKVRIWAGIRHQIRCHLSHIGHPIAGDKLYQRIKHQSRDWLDLKRHFLHASKIGFVHPISGRYIEFESPLPSDLEQAILQLKKT